MRIALASFLVLAACTETWPEAGPPSPPSLATTGVTSPARNPIPGDALAVGAVDFGTIEASGQVAGTVAITNVSGADVEVGAVMVTGAQFEVQASTCTGALAAGASCEVTVIFTPGAIGRFVGAIAVAPNGRVMSSPLTGAGGGLIRLTVEGNGAVGGDAAEAAAACADACTTIIAEPMTLHAQPADGGSFVMWMGACAGRAECVIAPSMTAQSVKAVFNR